MTVSFLLPSKPKLSRLCHRAVRGLLSSAQPHGSLVQVLLNTKATVFGAPKSHELGPPFIPRLRTMTSHGLATHHSRPVGCEAPCASGDDCHDICVCSSEETHTCHKIRGRPPRTTPNLSEQRPRPSAGPRGILVRSPGVDGGC